MANAKNNMAKRIDGSPKPGLPKTFSFLRTDRFDIDGDLLDKVNILEKAAASRSDDYKDLVRFIKETNDTMILSGYMTIVTFSSLPYSEELAGDLLERVFEGNDLGLKSFADTLLMHFGVTVTPKEFRDRLFAYADEAMGRTGSEKGIYERKETKGK